ncbi:hypothetical protein [Streptococcus dentiloxodontae]
MAKKITWQDQKKRYEDGLKKLEKLQEQAQDLEAKMTAQETLNQNLLADYLTALAKEGGKSLEEIEQLILTPHHS